MFLSYIGRVAREVLEGNVREIVGKMALEEMVSDRQKFAMLVKENAEPDLAAMGLDIISFNVQNFVDGNGVIENLGVDNIVKIQKNALIELGICLLLLCKSFRLGLFLNLSIQGLFHNLCLTLL
mgnify:CR=1 FL=1